MWSVLGFPLTSVITPLWLCMGKDQPLLVMPDKNGIAPLCDKAIRLKLRLFPITKSYGENYMDINALYNEAGTGVMQKLKPIDDLIFEETNKKLDSWRNNKDFKKEIPAFYKFLDDYITQQYLSLFGI